MIIRKCSAFLLSMLIINDVFGIQLTCTEYWVLSPFDKTLWMDSDEYLYSTKDKYKEGKAFVCQNKILPDKPYYCPDDSYIFMPTKHYHTGFQDRKALYKCVAGFGDSRWEQVDIDELPTCSTSDNVHKRLFDTINEKYIYCSIGTERSYVCAGSKNICVSDKIILHEEGETEPADDDKPQETKPADGDKPQETKPADGDKPQKTKPVVDDDKSQETEKNVPASMSAKKVSVQKQTVPSWEDCKDYVSDVYAWIKNNNGKKCPTSNTMNICDNNVVMKAAKNMSIGDWLLAADEICEGKSCDVKFNTVIKCDNEEIKLNNEKISLTPEEMQSVTKSRILTCKQFNSEYATNGDVAGQFMKSKGKCGTLVYNKKDAEEKARQAEAERQEQERIKREKAELKKKFDTAADDLVPFFSKVESERSVWKNADGSFNATRLASDLTAGVVLGTVGGVVSGVLIKKAQVEKGFDALNCSVGGQKVADWGDEFKVGFKR